MTRHEETWTRLVAIPRDFTHGLVGGLAGPLLALAGALGLIFALTRRLPAIKEVVRSSGERDRAIVLASVAEARASWARYGGELRGAIIELRARRNAHRRT
jgi:hypothetical protein